MYLGHGRKLLNFFVCPGRKSLGVNLRRLLEASECGCEELSARGALGSKMMSSIDG